MNDWWLKFGCFLTGYKYSLVKHSSVASAKTVYKYTSAMMLVSLLWCFIGYYFTQRYLKTGHWGSIAGAIILAFAIIQIERQIILTFGANNKIIRLRIGLAFVMAIIGSIIVDQLMFAQDIDKKKITTVTDEVTVLLPKRTSELNDQIKSLDTLINSKEKERQDIIQELSQNPTVPIYKETINYRNDSTGKSVKSGVNIEKSSIVNPKNALVPQIDQQISDLNTQRIQKENLKLNIQGALYKEINEKQGFLDELKVFFSLFSSIIVVIVWILFLLFFLFIELLVVFSKLGDQKNDYEYMLLHQMKIRIDQLKAINNEPI